MKKLYIFLFVIFFLPLIAHAQTKLTWHGHAAFEIQTPNGLVLLIDPWLTNPANPNSKQALSNLKKADYLLITHGHFDHVGDAVAIAKKTGARLVTNFELGTNLAAYQGFPKNQMGFDTLFNIGGHIQLGNGEVTVTMVPAVHSSGLQTKDGKIVEGGSPAGFIIQIKNGPTLYHSGDTAYFTDMLAIGKEFKSDVALVNIGGHFGMEPADAARAARDVHAKIAIPHHYATFPILSANAQSFLKAAKKEGVKTLEMKPGQTLEFKGNRLEKSK